MRTANPQTEGLDDLHGTYVFDLRTSNRTLAFNRFFWTMIHLEYREAFWRDEEAAMAAAGLDDTEKTLVRARDWLGIVHYGVNFFVLEKWARVVKRTNLEVYAIMRGETLEEFMATGGFPMHDDLGTKEVLYLLPGLLCDDSIWMHQVAALRDRYDVRVADFRSFASLHAMAASVLEAAPSRFSVAGHSMGARVALEIVRLGPGRIVRLALLDTGIHPPRPGEPAQRQILVDLADAQGMDALADRWLPPMVHPGRRGDAAFMGGLRRMVNRMSPAIYRNQVAALLGRPDAAAVLPLLGMPVLIGVGRQDEWSPPAQHEPIAASLPHATFVIFEDSGHMAPLEAPATVTRALQAWMAEPVNEHGLQKVKTLQKGHAG